MVESLQGNNGQELLYILISLKKMSHLNTGQIKLVYHPQDNYYAIEELSLDIALCIDICAGAIRFHYFVCR